MYTNIKFDFSGTNVVVIGGASGIGSEICFQLGTRGATIGVVLNISTIYGPTGSGYVVPSAVAKSGVISLTRSLAAEWGKFGIRHLAIAPGIVPTEGAMSRLAPTDDIKKMLIERIPLKRYGKMEELVNLATFLISDGCPFLNGDVISIDGGEGLWLSGQFNFLDVLSDQEWEAIKSHRNK